MNVGLNGRSATVSAKAKRASSRLGKMILVCAALATGVCCAYAPAPGMKTPWGGKVTPENAWREYPRPQLVRDAWTNLNGLWQYAVLGESPSFPTNWTGEILVPFVIESSLSGVGRLLKPEETLWYRRTFTADVKPGTRLLLNFEQADFRAQVFVNRVEVGVPHEGGQMPFSFDVTDYVKPGENELIVSIWDPTGFIGSSGKQSKNPRGCFYTRSSGIGGTVWLETVPETHVTDYTVTSDLAAGTVSVTVAGVGNLSEAEVKVEVRRGGRTLAKGEMKAWGRPVTLALPQPLALWSPETPELYDLVITMKDDATDAKDVVKGYFGLRAFELRKDAKGVLRFFLNGQARFILGTLDQGWWPDGLLTPPSDEAMAFDILQLKQAGFDMMRKHIKVEPRRYYHLCDKLGILVLQDMPSGGGGSKDRYGFYRRELKEMMDHLQKTPSVVMWVPYNEGWGQPGQFLTHSTLMWVQRYDPTRLVNGPSGWNDWEGGQAHRGETKHLPAGEEEAAHAVDKHDYGASPRMFPTNDRRASFLGEFGGLGCRVPGHLWTENAWGYGGTGKNVDRAAMQQRYVLLMNHVGCLAYRGLAGSVYTQTTDVEGEINGLITYDRRVVKFDSAALAASHAKVRALAALGAAVQSTTTLVPKHDSDPKAWAYTFTAPAEDWFAPGFDDSAWARSAGGFGTSGIERGHPSAKVVTQWSTKAIWTRRHFTCTKPRGKLLAALFEMFHDEDAEVYLNGTRILSVKGYVGDYDAYLVEAEAFAKAVKEGDNVLAVKVIQTEGGQYFDLGLSLLSE